MPFSQTLRWSACLAFIAATLAGCSDGTGPGQQPPAVAVVTITPAADTLAVAATLQLTATLRDGAGNTLNGRQVTWTSADDVVASVTGEGRVTALAEGSTRITATADGRTAQAEVRVVAGRAVVTSAGGMVATADGQVELEFPAGALASSTPVTIARVDESTLPAGFLPGTAFELGPSRSTFSQPVRISIAYDPATLPEGADEGVLRLHRLTDGAWLPVGGESPAEGRATALVNGFSVYAVAVAQADLVLQMSVAPSPAQLGEALTHTLLVVNVGPADVTNLSVDLYVLGDVLIQSPGQEGCEDMFMTNPPAKLLRCPIASLPAGLSHTLVLGLVPQAPGQTLVSTAEIARWEGAADPNPTNNRVQISTPVAAGPSADVSVEMTVAPNPVEVGQELTHTITVRNAGPDPVANVELRVEVRGQIAYRETHPSCERYSSANPPVRLVVCNLASLTPGSAQTIPLVVVPEIANQTLTSIASLVDWDGPPDPDPSNNQVTVSIAVAAPPPPAAPTWVAVGDGGASLATSTDGFSWTARQSPLGRGRAVTRANGLWVAVGDISAADASVALVTSTDGLTWTARTTPFGNTAFTVAHNGSRWIAGAAARSGSPTLATSTDGINWTAPAQPPFMVATLDVAWNGQMWVAVGAGGVGTGTTIARSTDGITWTASQSPFGASTSIERSGWGVAWNGQMWVAVGQGETAIATSTDGINWTARSSPLTSGSGVAWNGALWVAVGEGSATLVTSPDGITWTARTAPFTTGRGVAWNGQMWVATGAGGSARIATSTNGTTWTARSSPFSGAAWDAAPATAPPPPPPPGPSGLWVMVGNPGGWGSDAIATSPSGDPYSWAYRTSPLSIGHGVARGDTLWVAVGEGSAPVATSRDGITWSGRAAPIGRVYGVASKAGLWVAVGEGGIMTSTDAITWTARQSALSIGRGVAWNGSLWVAVGEGDAKIVTSSDGVTWTARDAPFTTQGRAVAWNGSQWVAVGFGGVAVATSPDGVTWTARSTPLASGLAVAWNGAHWLATGGARIIRSEDGISWTTAYEFQAQYPFGYGIAWNGTKWLVVGEDDFRWAVLMESPDGTTWQQRWGSGNPPILFRDVRAIAWSRPLYPPFP
jgi:hypothetical protein